MPLHSMNDLIHSWAETLTDLLIDLRTSAWFLLTMFGKFPLRENKFPISKAC